MATRTKTPTISSILAAAAKENGIKASDVTKAASLVSDVGGFQTGLGTATGKLRTFLKDNKALIKTKEANRAFQDSVFFSLGIVVFTLSESGERIQSREYITKGNNNGESLYETWRSVRHEILGGSNTEEPVTTLPRGISKELPAVIGERFAFERISRKGDRITVSYKVSK